MNGAAVGVDNNLPDLCLRSQAKHLREGFHLIYQKQAIILQNKSELPAHHLIKPTRIVHMNSYCSSCHRLIQSIIQGCH